MSDLPARVPGSAGSRIPRPTPRSHRSVSLPPAAQPAPAPSAPLQDRRRPSLVQPLPEMRRTPSLSIYIPPPPPDANPADLPAAPSAAPRSAARVRPSPTSAGGPFSAGAAASASWPRPPRTPYPKRPPRPERTPSMSTVATYTSFDLRPPRTPADEREPRDVDDGSSCWTPWRGWRRSTASLLDPAANHSTLARADARDLEAQSAPPPRPVLGETTALLGHHRDASPKAPGQTRVQYILAETWCYAKHMLPPILFFVVLVLVVALAAYRQAIARIVHPPHP